jgi:hypothetical protein
MRRAKLISYTSAALKIATKSVPVSPTSLLATAPAPARRR